MNTLTTPNRDMLKCKKDDKFQFERLGYFCLDYDSNLEQGKLVWNRIVTLQDREKSKAMAKIEE